MDRESRLTKRSDFAAVYRGGRAWAHPLVVLRAMPNGSDRSRLGFVVSKRLGKAVSRNRVRRRLREALRRMPLEMGWDVVVIARTPAQEASFRELAAALEQLLTRAKLLARGPSREQGEGDRR
ncbi:MAG: ribonuclease P protein component [Chloroflexi bacterium]|nr:ribonuclease P protein component [Chloroflexota bacterium]